MEFGSLFAVKDVRAARAFYEELFGITVTEDYGLMVGFDCGLSLQQDFAWLTGVPKEAMKTRENNCELYFEAADFDALVQKVRLKKDIELLHDVRESTWGQRSIRFYDLDEHLIEVGESMKAVVRKFLDQGMTREAVAVRMDLGLHDVEKILKK